MVNRIVGLLVVLAVGILLSPLLVSHYDNGLQAKMVKAPSFPNEDAQSATIQALGDQAKLAVLPAKKVHGANLSSAAWVVQLGGHQDRLAALRLVNQLREKGYKAFVHQKAAAYGNELIVFIGPEVKRDSAEMLASKLAKETKLSATIKSYKPLAT